MKPLLTAATVALGLAAAPMAFASGETNPDRQAYESQVHQMIEAKQAEMNDGDLSDDAKAAWAEVQESWTEMTEAADENWEAAKQAFQENWQDFEQEWKEMTDGSS
ncbi:hypothetical protein HH303_06195 [Rhodospirillaceae bacterium KN72]|uniref:Uncharacterized protein n=1 Tax=Pacificispira spongiicola TaxID=2729598 RepID=A0A7Y0DYP9_9PROT|nr:hypothetical protein [Pacificispira spongiicola]NMM44059.1 hypothetical protein [Pacificispira spongiicola]